MPELEVAILWARGLRLASGGFDHGGTEDTEGREGECVGHRGDRVADKGGSTSRFDAASPF